MKSKKPDSYYDHACEHCDGGWVRRVIRPRELIRVTKTDFVALEKVPIGVCDRCKARYYHASVLKQASALHKKGATRKVEVPVTRYVQAS